LLSSRGEARAGWRDAGVFTDAQLMDIERGNALKLAAVHLLSGGLRPAELFFHFHDKRRDVLGVFAADRQVRHCCVRQA
jgi:hypothetical protein